jgi:hypothetical protein
MQPPDSESPYPNERRAHPRTPCSAQAQIAPYTLGVSLSNLQFQTVTMKDLSAGGISFWAAVLPRYAEIAFPLLTEFGESGMMLAHVRKVERSEGRFLVHCQFVRRLSDQTG